MSIVQPNIEEVLGQEIYSFVSNAGTLEFGHSMHQEITYDDFLNDKMLIIMAIRAGIPYTIFNLIKKITPFTESEWADFLDISTKSLQRYKSSSEHHFKSIHSEKIIEIAEVTKAGLDVFGNMEKLRLWLNTPNFALGQVKPIELLKDSYGKEMVMRELLNIDHGILV